MEFSEVVRRRRMIRTYDTARDVDPATLEAIVRVMLRAPSAGFSQGTGMLVLSTPSDIQRFREAATPERDAENWFAARVDAPAMIIPCANKSTYLDRYAEADKGFTDRSDEWWSAPYWDIDAGMAALMGLLAAVDHELGACFFGVEISCVPRVQSAFGIPSEFRPIGVISLGYPNEPPRDLSARRRPVSTLVHHGRWHVAEQPH